MENTRDLPARRGLTLSRRVLRRLDEVGILVQSGVSLEHQHLAARYVVRGMESGGAVKDLGRYVTFCGPDGQSLPYLHLIDSVGVNGVHAVAVAPVLVRVELFRAGRTCQLLITNHQPGRTETGRRPPLENSVLFRGVNGLLDLELSPTDGNLPERSMIPKFWSRGGENVEVPEIFKAAVVAATEGTNCIGCSHAHFLTAPQEPEVRTRENRNVGLSR